jgi:hypothetical protein
MAKVEVSTNNLHALDRALGPPGDNLEIKPEQQRRRPSPFTDFHGWGPSVPKAAPKPATTPPVIAPKPIKAQSPIVGVFKKASDAMKAYAKALEENPQNADKIKDKELEAANAQNELSAAIGREADLMYRNKQAVTREYAILQIVEVHVTRKKVAVADEVLFREAAKQALAAPK